jgi:uncharacterized protein YndB with AHSA1/START domain
MPRGLISTASTTVHAPAARVWEALTDPAMIRQYLFGADVESDWQQGSSIVWRGMYEGRRYEDKGTILQVEPQRILQYTHYSSLTGQPDLPEHYHTITVALAERDGETVVTLSQDNNPGEESRAHTAAFWQAMLDRLKALLER